MWLARCVLTSGESHRSVVQVRHAVQPAHVGSEIAQMQEGVVVHLRKEEEEEEEEERRYVRRR